MDIDQLVREATSSLDDKDESEMNTTDDFAPLAPLNATFEIDSGTKDEMDSEEPNLDAKVKSACLESNTSASDGDINGLKDDVPHGFSSFDVSEYMPKLSKFLDDADDLALQLKSLSESPPERKPYENYNDNQHISHIDFVPDESNAVSLVQHTLNDETQGIGGNNSKTFDLSPALTDQDNFQTPKMNGMSTGSDSESLSQHPLSEPDQQTYAHISPGNDMSSMEACSLSQHTISSAGGLTQRSMSDLETVSPPTKPKEFIVTSAEDEGHDHNEFSTDATMRFQSMTANTLVVGDSYLEKKPISSSTPYSNNPEPELSVILEPADDSKVSGSKEVSLVEDVIEAPKAVTTTSRYSTENVNSEKVEIVDLELGENLLTARSDEDQGLGRDLSFEKIQRSSLPPKSSSQSEMERQRLALAGLRPEETANFKVDECLSEPGETAGSGAHPGHDIKILRHGSLGALCSSTRDYPDDLVTSGYRTGPGSLDLHPLSASQRRISKPRSQEQLSQSQEKLSLKSLRSSESGSSKTLYKSSEKLPLSSNQDKLSERAVSPISSSASFHSAISSELITGHPKTSQGSDRSRKSLGARSRERSRSRGSEKSKSHHSSREDITADQGLSLRELSRYDNSSSLSGFDSTVYNELPSKLGVSVRHPALDELRSISPSSVDTLGCHVQEVLQMYDDPEPDRNLETADQRAPSPAESQQSDFLAKKVRNLLGEDVVPPKASSERKNLVSLREDMTSPDSTTTSELMTAQVQPDALRFASSHKSKLSSNASHPNEDLELISTTSETSTVTLSSDAQVKMGRSSPSESISTVDTDPLGSKVSKLLNSEHLEGVVEKSDLDAETSSCESDAPVVNSSSSRTRLTRKSLERLNEMESSKNSRTMSKSLERLSDVGQTSDITTSSLISKSFERLNLSKMPAEDFSLLKRRSTGKLNETDLTMNESRSKSSSSLRSSSNSLKFSEGNKTSLHRSGRLDETSHSSGIEQDHSNSSRSIPLVAVADDDTKSIASDTKSVQSLRSNVSYDHLQQELDAIQRGLEVLQSGDLSMSHSSSAASLRVADLDKQSESSVEIGTPRLYSWDYGADLMADVSHEGFITRLAGEPGMSHRSRSHGNINNSAAGDGESDVLAHWETLRRRRKHHQREESIRSLSCDPEDSAFTRYRSHDIADDSDSLDTSFTHQIEAIYEKDNPSTEAYRFLREADEQQKALEKLSLQLTADQTPTPRRSNLSSDITTPNLSITPQAPLAALGNIQTFLAKQVDKRSNVDFDRSLDSINSPMPENITSKLLQSNEIYKPTPTYADVKRAAEDEKRRREMEEKLSYEQKRFEEELRQDELFREQARLEAQKRDEEKRAEIQRLHEEREKEWKMRMKQEEEKREELRRQQEERKREEERLRIERERLREERDKIEEEQRRWREEKRRQTELRLDQERKRLIDQARKYRYPEGVESSSPERKEVSGAIYPHRRGLGATIPGLSKDDARAKNESPITTNTSFTSISPGDSSMDDKSIDHQPMMRNKESFYTETSETDDCGASVTTMESAHPGSDDAYGPEFPPSVLGSRTDARQNSEGIYHKKKSPRDTSPLLDPIQEERRSLHLDQSSATITEFDSPGRSPGGRRLSEPAGGHADVTLDNPLSRSLTHSGEVTIEDLTKNSNKSQNAKNIWEYTADDRAKRVDAIVNKYVNPPLLPPMDDLALDDVISLPEVSIRDVLDEQLKRSRPQSNPEENDLIKSTYAQDIETLMKMDPLRDDSMNRSPSEGRLHSVQRRSPVKQQSPDRREISPERLSKEGQSEDDHGTCESVEEEVELDQNYPASSKSTPQRQARLQNEGQLFSYSPKLTKLREDFQKERYGRVSMPSSLRRMARSNEELRYDQGTGRYGHEALDRVTRAYRHDHPPTDMQPPAELDNRRTEAWAKHHNELQTQLSHQESERGSLAVNAPLSDRSSPVSKCVEEENLGGETSSVDEQNYRVSTKEYELEQLKLAEQKILFEQRKRAEELEIRKQELDEKQRMLEDEQRRFEEEQRLLEKRLFEEEEERQHRYQEDQRRLELEMLKDAAKRKQQKLQLMEEAAKKREQQEQAQKAALEELQRLERLKQEEEFKRQEEELQRQIEEARKDEKERNRKRNQRRGQSKQAGDRNRVVDLENKNVLLRKSHGNVNNSKNECIDLQDKSYKQDSISAKMRERKIERLLKEDTSRRELHDNQSHPAAEVEPNRRRLQHHLQEENSYQFSEDDCHQLSDQEKTDNTLMTSYEGESDVLCESPYVTLDQSDTLVQDDSSVNEVSRVESQSSMKSTQAEWDKIHELKQLIQKQKATLSHESHRQQKHMAKISRLEVMLEEKIKKLSLYERQKREERDASNTTVTSQGSQGFSESFQSDGTYTHIPNGDKLKTKTAYLVCECGHKVKVPNTDVSSKTKKNHTARKTNKPEAVTSSLKLQEKKYNTETSIGHISRSRRLVDPPGSNSTPKRKSRSTSQRRVERSRSRNNKNRNSNSALPMAAVKAGRSSSHESRSVATNIPTPLIELSPPRRKKQEKKYVVSEGVQTTPHTSHIKVKDTQDKQISSKESMPDEPLQTMYVPESRWNGENHTPSLRRKIKIPDPLAWYIPVPEDRPWRKPLQERQNNAAKMENEFRQRIAPSKPCQPMNSNEELRLLEKDLLRDLRADTKKLSKLTLQEALETYRPDFVSQSRSRQRSVALKADERRVQEIHNRHRAILFAERNRQSKRTSKNRKVEQNNPVKKRQFSMKEMREDAQRKYKKLPEVRANAELRKRQEEYKTNRLKAKLFQQKVLNHVLRRGQAWVQ